MLGLKNPLNLPSLDVDGYGGVAIEVVAGPIPAIGVRARTAHGKINDPSVLIDCESERPNIIARAILPTFKAPRFDYWLAFARYRVKFPEFLAGARVIGVCVAGFAGARVQLRRD